MFNIDNTLETFIMADYSVARLMHKLRRLAIREYKLNNFGECSKRCISWFKLYSIILPNYIKYPDIFTTHELNTEILNNTDFRFNFVINQLRDSKYKEVLYWYTDCRKFLVGPVAYCLLEKINTIMPKHEKYEIFMNYSDIVVADKGLHNTQAHWVYMIETLTALKKAKKYNRMVNSENMVSALESISIKPREVDTYFVTTKINKIKQIDCVNLPVNNTNQTLTLPVNDCVPKKSGSVRLTYENAKVGMIISYATKKGTEYAKVTKVSQEYVETLRLKKDSEGRYTEHKVSVCRASQNKPAFTRVINILEQ